MNQSAEILRRLDNMIRLGTIASVDHGAALCTVKTGQLTTRPLKWLNLRAGSTKEWNPPTQGEDCIVFSPSGELAQGIVLVGMFSQDNPAPSQSPDHCLTTYPDGASIEYNHKTHALNARLPVGATILLIADGGMTLQGDLSIQGGLSVSKSVAVGETVTAAADVISQGISLATHTHPGTGAPQ